MSFAAPLLLGLFGLAAPVVVLYVLKVKRRRVDVPYLRLWEELLVETRARSLFQRLKRLYSLLLQLLILACLVLALAEPAFDLSSVKKESIVLLLDTSASMQALEEDGSTRFERLAERARELVENRSFEDEMMIVAVSDRVDVLASFNRNTLLLRDALERLAPTNRSLDVERAYAFAREVSREREHPVLLFLSDGAAGAVEAVIGKDEQAHLLAIGETTENVGIARFSARKNTSLGTDYVLAVVHNYGDEPADVRLELAVDANTKQVLSRTIAPGADVTERFDMPLPDGGTLRLSTGLSTGASDALAVDDEAWAVVRPSRLRRVLVVTLPDQVAEPFWIAFEAMAEVIHPDSRLVTAEEYAQLSEEERRADVTLCIGVVPEELPTEGNVILMDTDVPDFLPARFVGVDPEPEVWDWDREHLLNRYLNYRDLPIPPARVLELDGGTALVQSYRGPLISAFDDGRRRVVHVAFDMTAELFPFRLAFPLLLRNAIAWFEIEEDLVLEASYAPGDAIQPLRRVAGAVAQVSWMQDGVVQTRELPVREGRFTFQETEQPGAFLFRIGGGNHSTTVNLFDAGESDIRPPAPADGASDEYVEVGRHLFNRDLWGLLAMLALALGVAEWALYHRRITE